MAGAKISEYSVADVNFTALMQTVDAQRKGFMAVNLTNYANNNKPEIKAGSRIEINGALYGFNSDESLGGSPSDGVVYIKFIPSGSSVTAVLTNTHPIFDYEKNGFYEPLTNNRYAHYSMYKSGTDYLCKNDIFKPTGRIITGWTSQYIPWGWIEIFGQTLDSVTNPQFERLYHVWGTQFGGTGSNDFDAPDGRGRAPAGLDNMGGTPAGIVTRANADSIGGVLGSEYHTLTTGEIPAHDHDVNLNVSTSGSGAIRRADENAAGDHTANVDTEPTGGGGAHENMPPMIFYSAIACYL